MNRTPTLVAPWGNALGLTRSAISLALALTLVLTPTSVLFTPLLGLPDGPHCSGVSGLSAFCLGGGENVQAVRWILAVLLLVAASGLLPAVTALPAAWAASSVAVSISIPDGGDQVAAILLLLLLGSGLTDPRLHHWSPVRPDRSRRGPWATSIALTSVWAARVQVSVVYLFAAIGKFENPEWTNGSAIYYWVRHTSFGAPEYLDGVAEALTALPLLSAAVTWGTLVLELTLGISLLLPERVRLVLLPVAVCFHGGIAILMGITSFSLTMIGAAVLLLTPVGASWVIHRRTDTDATSPAEPDTDATSPAEPDADALPLQRAEVRS